MKALLDTHAFLWLVYERQQLSERVAAICRDPGNTLLVSVVSLWELVIKMQIGKLQLQSSLSEAVKEQEELNGIIVLPVRTSHVFGIEPLPLHHRDPFDRLLIAQAIAEQAVLLTRDSEFAAYPVQTMW